MPADHYATLGVDEHTDRVAIRLAYLRIVRENHPDRRPGDDRATERTRRANEAWAVLRDPARRAAYDRQRRAVTTPARTRSAFSATPARPAYSAHRRLYRDAFSRTVTRVAVAIFLLGVLVLLALS